jgi:hypothetical protein
MLEEFEAKFQFPTDSTLYGEKLISKRISVYWDGDNVYYPCLVKKYISSSDKHMVVYENDFSGKEYPENLRKQYWKIWTGSEEEYVEAATKVSNMFSY